MHSRNTLTRSNNLTMERQNQATETPTGEIAIEAEVPAIKRRATIRGETVTLGKIVHIWMEVQKGRDLRPASYPIRSNLRTLWGLTRWTTTQVNQSGRLSLKRESNTTTISRVPPTCIQAVIQNRIQTASPRGPLHKFKLTTCKGSSVPPTSTQTPRQSTTLTRISQLAQAVSRS